METYPLISTNWTNYTVTGTNYHPDEVSHILTKYGKRTENNEHYATLDFELVPEPENEYDPHAISVRKDNYLLGYIKARDTNKYLPVVNRIRESGYIPTLRGKIYQYYNREDGGISLCFEESDCLIPANEPPAGECFLIPPTRTVKLPDCAEYFDTLFDYIPQSGKSKLLITLEPEFYTSSGTEKKRLAATIEGHTIGHLSPVTAKKILPIVEHFEQQGITTCALATLEGSSLSAQVTIQISYAHEIDDKILENDVREFPQLVAIKESPDDYLVPTIPSVRANKKVDNSLASPSHVHITVNSTHTDKPEREPATVETTEPPVTKTPIYWAPKDTTQNGSSIPDNKTAPPTLKRKIITGVTGSLIGLTTTLVLFIIIALTLPPEGAGAIMALATIPLGVIAAVVWYKRKMSHGEQGKPNS